MSRIPALLLVAALINSCGQQPDRPEVIDKLRVVGVGAEPSVVVPSTAAAPQTVKLTLHALLPAGQQVDSVQAFVDENAKFSYLIENLAVNTTSQAYEELGGLRYFKVEASFLAPTTEILQAAKVSPLRMRYGIDVVAGAESERVVGDVLMVAPGDDALQWKPVTVNMTSPASEGATVGDGISLSMDTTSSPGDAVKSGWYVSSGQIENRRARSAKWEKPEAGAGVVIATARGSRSRSFAIQVRKVTVE